MSPTNQTLLTLLTRCQQMLLSELMAGGAKDRQATSNITEHDGGPGRPSPPGTTSASAFATNTSSTAVLSDQRKSYDNAYFYILFVMLFYFVLAGMLFKNFLRRDVKDPYEEFTDPRPASTGARGKFNPGLASAWSDFEEEYSLC